MNEEYPSDLAVIAMHYVREFLWMKSAMPLYKLILEDLPHCLLTEHSCWQ